MLTIINASNERKVIYENKNQKSAYFYIFFLQRWKSNLLEPFSLGSKKSNTPMADACKSIRSNDFHKHNRDRWTFWEEHKVR